ncbi:MAG: hypothetical protein K2Z25_18600 [Beijerinckiaceae bacterium]|nr:hypothetical protein [Beijerinckiaceae bacterium]
MSSLDRVGHDKVVGYLPLRTITKVLGLSVRDLMSEAAVRGLSTTKFGPRVCCIKSGALYVYDKPRLERLLEANRSIFSACDWPQDADAFVREIARNWLDADHALLPIVQEAFADR